LLDLAAKTVGKNYVPKQNGLTKNVGRKYVCRTCDQLPMKGITTVLNA